MKLKHLAKLAKWLGCAVVIYLYGAFKNPDHLLLQSKFYKKRIEKKNTPQYVANCSVSLKLLLFASFFDAAFLYNQLQKLWEKLLFGQLCVSTSFPS